MCQSVFLVIQIALSTFNVVSIESYRATLLYGNELESLGVWKIILNVSERCHWSIFFSLLNLRGVLSKYLPKAWVGKETQADLCNHMQAAWFVFERTGFSPNCW